MGKTSSRVKDRWNAKNYDSVNLRVPKGEKEKIKAFAARSNESLNKFINRLINEAMEKD